MEEDDVDEFDSDDDDEDDDEYKDDEDQFVDYVGDIESKLKANGLKCTKMTVGKVVLKGANVEDTVVRQNWLSRLNEDNALKLHRQRIVAFVDRRDRGKLTENGFIYKPPNNARDIPKDPVPEWFIASSMDTILPDMSYGDADSVCFVVRSHGGCCLLMCSLKSCFQADFSENT